MSLVLGSGLSTASDLDEFVLRRLPLCRVDATAAKYTLSSSPIHLIISSLCMCVSAVAGVMAGLGRHSSLSESVCVSVCV